MCYFLWQSTNTLLSALFATEARYTMKQNNNKEKSLSKLPFCRRKLPFCWWKLRKACFASAFFTGGNYHFFRCKLRKAYFASAFSYRGKKSELEGLNYKKSYFQLDMTLFSPNAASILSPCSDGKLHMFGTSWNLNKKAFLRSCRNISKEIIHWPSPCQLSFKRG